MKRIISIITALALCLTLPRVGVGGGGNWQLYLRSQRP